jgi:hypothetical protein
MQIEITVRTSGLVSPGIAEATAAVPAATWTATVTT